MKCEELDVEGCDPTDLQESPEISSTQGRLIL